MTPSEVLTRAADLIRDTAAAAVAAPWDANVCDVWFQGPYEAEMVADCGDARTARWIALMSPAVAPMIEAWLRQVQVRAARSEESAALLGWAEPIYREEVGPALALARAVLGEKEEQ